MSLEPARLNFAVWKGATFQKRLTYRSGNETSPPVDLTSYTAEMLIYDNTGNLLTLESTGGVSRLILGGSAGTIDILIPDTITTGFVWRAANYKLSATTSAGRKDFLLFGNFSIKG